MSRASSRLLSTALAAALAAAPLGPARADDAPRGGFAPVLEHVADGTDVRVGVDRAIREALALEAKGDLAGSIDRLREAVHASDGKDLKALHFLARAYRKEARALRASDPARAAADSRLAREHERAVLDLAAKARPGDAEYMKAAREHLAAFSKSTPVLDQYAEGGAYPWGYCGVTSLRMVLRLEGLSDPGADAVGLHGAAPYIPGSGSDGTLLAQRARELGLTGAQFSTTGSLDAIAASAERGRPVLVAGEGAFAAKLEDGSQKARSYDSGHWLVVTGASRGADGKVESVTLADPDGGHRETMSAEAFATFFGADGTVWKIDYRL